MTLSELKTLTIHQNGFSDKIASLDDCIEIAKALDVSLLIELKVHGQETEDVLPKLVEKLRKYKVLDSYYVQSADGQKMMQLKIGAEFASRYCLCTQYWTNGGKC